MTFPAWFDFYKDNEVRRHRAAAQVYAAFLALDRIMYDPRPVKAWVLAESEGIKKATVLSAINLLVERGYLVEHARSTNNVRTFTVAAVRSRAPQRTDSTAA